jgi:hypothetical protein
VPGLGVPRLHLRTGAHSEQALAPRPDEPRTGSDRYKLIANGLVQRARASIAPGINGQNKVPVYPLLRRPGEDSRLRTLECSTPNTPTTALMAGSQSFHRPSRDCDGFFVALPFGWGLQRLPAEFTNNAFSEGRKGVHHPPSILVRPKLRRPLPCSHT